MQQKTIMPVYNPDVSVSRIKATNDDKFSNLTILKTVLQDEGMYHCAHMDWTKSTWTGTYLSIEGNSGKTSSYTVFQNPVPDPVHPGDSETLHCSLFSESEDKVCSGELSVFWFRAGSKHSLPHIIRTNEKARQNCEDTSTLNNQKKCSYSFSRNFSSSEDGTVYCAVATCGEILFGRGTNSTAGMKKCSYSFSRNFSSSEDGTVYCAVATCGEILFGRGTNSTADQSPSSKVNVLIIIVICFAMSMIVNIAFICHQAQRSLRRNLKAQHNVSQPDNTPEDGQDLNYAALHISERKPSRGKMKNQLKTDSVYSQIKELN
ncbi:uncharacterized protein V3H82_004738 [Fundulus diaphanus]